MAWLLLPVGCAATVVWWIATFPAREAVDPVDVLLEGAVVRIIIVGFPSVCCLGVRLVTAGWAL